MSDAAVSTAGVEVVASPLLAAEVCAGAKGGVGVMGDCGGGGGGGAAVGWRLAAVLAVRCLATAANTSSWSAAGMKRHEAL